MTKVPPSWQKFKDSNEANTEYHRRLAITLTNPIRVKILEMLLEGPMTFEEISGRANLSRQQTRFHLDILKHGFCVQERDGKFVITSEGTVVKYFKKG